MDEGVMKCEGVRHIGQDLVLEEQTRSMDFEEGSLQDLMHLMQKT